MKTKIPGRNSALHVLLPLLVICTFSACHNDQTTGATDFVVDGITWSDSLSTSRFSAHCTITADVPQKGDKRLANSVREWLDEQLGGCSEPHSLKSDEFIARYGQALIDEAKKETEEIDDDTYSPDYEWVIALRKTDETREYVTYEHIRYAYTGGAHGSTLQNGMTFRKCDGRRFGWDMFRSGYTLSESGRLHDTLSALLKSAILTQYLDEEGKPYEEGMFFLDDDAPRSFPHPQTAPYLTSKGVRFVYQEYEIGPYCIGRPTCTLPYDQVKDLLTPTARALCE